MVLVCYRIREGVELYMLYTMDFAMTYQSTRLTRADRIHWPRRGEEDSHLSQHRIPPDSHEEP